MAELLRQGRRVSALSRDP
ncbi:hypothetical protein [Nocardia farcinica]